MAKVKLIFMLKINEKGGNNQNTQKPKQCLLRSSDVIMIR